MLSVSFLSVFIRYCGVFAFILTLTRCSVYASRSLMMPIRPAFAVAISEANIHRLVVAYDPLKEEIGSWHELGSSRASSYHAHSDYESSRVNKQSD